MNRQKTSLRIKVMKDGPYLVSGSVPLKQEIVVIGASGEPEAWKSGRRYQTRPVFSLCRCGGSQGKPFCDGTHFQAGFDGTETARRDAYLDRAEKTPGPELDLTWSREFCAVARFCHFGEEAWGYAERSDDPAAKKMAVQEACRCPSGSLVAWEPKTGRAIEPVLRPSISLVEIPQMGISGPIWVKGGIPIESADGRTYERRNRVTLCRCGRSRNKPFCDGTHIEIGFQSGA
jgi:CDGSH-type Zn-finger protein